MAKKGKREQIITYKHSNGEEYRIMSKDEVLDLMVTPMYVNKAFIEKVLESRIIFLKELRSREYIVVTPTELAQNFTYTVTGAENGSS